LSTENTRNVLFSVENNETIASIKAATDNGTFSRTEFVTISSGTYSSISLDANPLSPLEPVSTSIVMRGIKRGANNADLTFAIDGVENGLLNIRIKVDNVTQLDGVITIGTGGSASSIITASNGQAILTGSENATLEPLDLGPKDLPFGWYALSQIYEYTSERGDLTETTLSFRIPSDISPDPSKNTFFIARSVDGNWVRMPSILHQDPSGNFVSATIQQEGEYCLVSLGTPQHSSTGWKLPFSAFIPFMAILIVGFMVYWNRR
jgi:hypothetical protein